jgi:RNA polymerase sigma factor (sigma-70 family)
MSLKRMEAKNTIYKDLHHDLIKKCKKQDQRSQMQIYKLYYKAMFNTCLRIVGNKSDAEDIMQDSFLSAFQKIEQYNEKGSFGGWLKRIVVNNSIDFTKRNKIFTEFDDQIELEEESSTEQAEINIRLKDIKEALNRIKNQYRIIISLFLFEGYDHDEISEILNISYNLSRTRYHRAKEQLKKEINKIQEERNVEWA